MSDTERDRIKAAELFSQARKLEKQRDYTGAQKLYKKSLQLHEDDEVRNAYLKLLSALGPM
jgi:hypothetical protein